MKGFYISVVSLLISILILPRIGLSEGTKELMPDSANNKRACIMPANGNSGGNLRDPFALYNGDTNYRLKIHIEDCTVERIYFGLGAVVTGGGAVNWRIHEPDGTVLWSGTTPTSGTGFIQYASQAYAGPDVIDPHGYPARKVIPPVNGEYFMTFQIPSNSTRVYRYFDITVVDTTTFTVKNGRVFSKCWQLSTNEPSAHGFFGYMYPYSTDGVVTKFNPNGFDGRWFSVCCNESGCYKIDSLHNAQQARRSTNGWHNYPQYRIFLNDPDTSIYPSGVVGQLVPGSLSTVTYCLSGTIDFIFQTTANGTVEITLELSSLGAPYVDRKLIEYVTGGIDTITWDGKDGNGLNVPSGSTFLFSLRYYNGLTHLPLWDVENNASGFQVSLVRPQADPPIPDPEFFWDDSQVGGTVLIDPPGCNSASSGCHVWTGDWGDNKTINTWWFIVSTSTEPVYLTYKKGPQNLGVISGPDQFCQGATVQYSVAADPNSSLYIWTWPGGTDTTVVSVITISFPINIPPGSEQITVHGYNNDCGDGPVSTKSIMINQIPSVTNTPLNKTICSNANVNIQLTADVTGTTFQWHPTCGVPAITGYADGGGTTINDILVNSGYIPGMVDYRITPFAAGCQGDSVHYIVTVNPVPDLTNNPLVKFICSNTGTNITLTSNVSGTLFTWTVSSNPNVTGQTDNSTPTVTLNQTLVNLSYVNQTVTYAITPHANNCDGITYFFNVIVYPKPDLTNSPLSKQQCNNLQTNITLTSNVSGTLFTWTTTGSSPGITGYADNSTPAAIINQTLVNSGYNVETVTYHITPIANGCSGDVYDYVVTVYPTPDLSNSPLNKSQCNNNSTNIPLTSHVTGTLFTWTANGSSPAITGYADNSTPVSAINQTLVNTGYNIETVTYHIIPHANGCNGPVYDYVVTVYPTPDLSNTPLSKQICNNTATNITLTSHVSGTLFTWSCSSSSPALTGYSDNSTPTATLNQTISNSGYTTETVTYHITPKANGCNGPITDFVVTVYPTPDLSNTPLSKQQCNNTATNVTLASHVSGTLFTWTATGSSPNITGYSDNPTPTLTLNQILVNSGYTSQTVTYHITPHANGCNGPLTDFLVTVYPTPDLSNTPLSKQICNNTATNITLASHVSGTLFTWTATGSSGNVSGFSNNSTPTVTLNQTLVNTGYNIETVTYHITPRANDCNGPVTDYIVTVFPVPDLSNSPLNMQVCNNTPTNQTLTSHVTGTLFTWTATGSSPNVTGYSDNSTPTNYLNQTLVNSGLNVEYVTYHMMPHANGCNGVLTDYVVTVVSSPDVYFNPAAQTICSQQTSSIQVLSHVPGTTFSWTASASSPNLTGYSSGNGSLIAQTITNSGTTIETVTYTVTPTAWGCPPGLPQNVVLTVNPRPAVTNSVTTFQQCSATTTNIALQSNVPGTTFSWTASGSSGNISGFSGGSGSQIHQTLVNAGFNNETVTYAVTPTANGCPGNIKSFTVTVFPVPDVYFTPPSQSICPLMTTNIANNSHVTGSTYAWTATGSSLLVSGYSPGSGSQIKQTLNNTGYSIETVTYHVSPAANGCPGITSDVVASVNPNPVVSLPLCMDPVTTTAAQPVKLKGGIPRNGTYSGKGVSGSILNPAAAGAGMDTIKYSYTNAFGCPGSSFVILSIIAPVPFSCGNVYTDPRDNRQYQTVQIGTQCWMAASLDYGTQIFASGHQRDNCSPEKYCYDDNSANCTSYGGLYQWDELMRYDNVESVQGLCPPEWHVPSETEWNALFNYYISNGFAGSPLKYSGYSGFNALLKGVQFRNVSWSYLNFATFFWSSTSHGPNKAWAHGMNDPNPSVSLYPSMRNNAFPVRCLKD